MPKENFLALKKERGKTKKNKKDENKSWKNTKTIWKENEETEDKIENNKKKRTTKLIWIRVEATKNRKTLKKSTEVKFCDAEDYKEV